MLKRIFHIDHIIVTLLALLIMWFMSFIVLNVNFFNPISRSLQNFQLSDMYYQIMKDSGKETVSPLITIVDVSALYDRAEIAEVINKINDCNPRLVGVDIIFGGLKGDTLGSDLLAEAIMNTENPVVAYKLTEYDNEKKEFTSARHSFFAPSDGVSEGFSNVGHDAFGGPVRYITTTHNVNGERTYSLAYEIARCFDKDIALDSTSMDKRMIDYTPTVFPVVRYDSIEQNRDLLKNRIVILGGMHDDADMHYSPYGRTSGTYIQAYAVQTLMENKHIEELNSWVSAVVSFLMILLTQVFQSEFIRWSSKRKSLILQVIFGSTLINNLINFVWIGLLVWINFIVFVKFDCYFPSTMMLLGLAMLVESRSFYKIVIQKLGKKHEWRFAKSSLYNN